MRWPVLDEMDACLEIGFDFAIITVFAGSLGRDLTPVLFAWPCVSLTDGITFTELECEWYLVPSRLEVSSRSVAVGFLPAYLG